MPPLPRAPVALALFVAGGGCALNHPSFGSRLAEAPADVADDVTPDAALDVGKDVADAAADVADAGYAQDDAADVADDADAGATDAADASDDAVEALDAPDVPDGVTDVPDVPDAVDAPDAPCTGASCVYARCEDVPGRASGAYTLRVTGGTGTWRAYCEFPAAGAPWTLVMKVDGARSTFPYDADFWTTPRLHRPNDVDLSTAESKYEGFNSLPFREVRLQVQTRASLREAVVTTAAPDARWPSLLAVFSAAVSPPPPVTGDYSGVWSRIFANSGLQERCRRFGFNVRPAAGAASARVRLGVVADESDDRCSSPDSWVGVGGTVDNRCTPSGGARLSAGNVNGCDEWPWDSRAEPSFVWVWVR